MVKPRSIVLLGPPACGKGTVAKSLVTLLDDVHHISTGDLIRNNLEDFSGNYRSDDVIRKLLVDEISRVNAGLYVLDGVPRTLSQVGVVDDLFDVRKVFYFDNLNKDTLFNRMKLRGRDEDFFKRTSDFVEKTACLQSFYSILMPDLYVSLDGNSEPHDNILKILQYI